MAAKPRVVLIGDSIRMAYQDHVVGALINQAEVVGPAANGGHSRRVLAHLDEWAMSRRPDLVHVNCGLHDLKRAFGEACEVPLREYGDNVRQVLTRLQNELACKVIWAATTPVDETQHHQNKGFDRFEADVDAYNKMATAVAGDLAVPVHDLFAVVEQRGRAQLLTSDGVHFTAEGSQFLGRAVADCAREHLGL